jgi:hypothetical protein
MKKCRYLLSILFSASLLCSSAVSGSDEPVPMVRDVINVREFGAKGDGITDDTEALQKAIDEALQVVGGLKPDVKYEWRGNVYPGYPPIVVYIPRGTYLVKKTINVSLGTYSWNKSIRISGEFARIRAGEKMDSVMHVNTAGHIKIEGLSIDGAGLAQHGFTAFKISGRDSLIERVNVGGALSHGIVLEKCQGSVFRACSSDGNAGDGWQIIDCNAALFDCVRAMHNKGNGYSILSKDFSAGCTMTNFWSEGNGGHGLLVSVSKANATVVIRDGWVEGPGLDGIRIESIGTVLEGVQVVGGGNRGIVEDNRAIRVTKTAAGSHITGCYVQRGPTSGKAYGRITVEGSLDKHYIAGNFYRFRGTPVAPEAP